MVYFQMRDDLLRVCKTDVKRSDEIFFWRILVASKVV